MSDLNDLFKLVSEGKKQSPKAQKVAEVKQNARKDLDDIFEQLSSIKEDIKTVEAKQEDMIVEDMLTEVSPIPAQPVIRTPEQRIKDTNADVSKYLTGKTFQQPNPDPVDKNLEAIQAKMKFLEQAIGKIAATGPGGGEVNLRWLDDVDRSTIEDGHFLKYNAAKKKFDFVEIKAETALQDTGEPMGHQNLLESQISFDDASRTFTISPRSASYVIYTRGTRRVITDTRTVTIPDETGLYYIYFDTEGVLRYRTTFFDWPNDCMTAYVYWNGDINDAVFVADERHGITLDWQTHEYLHRTRGAAYANGFVASNYILNGDGSLNSHMQMDLAGGTFFDEDLQVDIVSSNTPMPNSWEQDLSGPTRIPMFYRINGSWVIDTPTNFLAKQGTVRPRFNVNTGGVWSVADIDNNKFGITFIIATNNINYPIIGIIGQTDRANQADADADDFSDLDLTGFPVVEFRPLYKLVYDCKTAYTNTIKARLTSLTDLRRIQSV
jgi:hypothetical protein